MIFATTVEAAPPAHAGKDLISETEMLGGFSGTLFPFIDVTPNKMVNGHIAIVDDGTCDGNIANQPAIVEVLVGIAGVELDSLVFENTAIVSGSQCVFHGTFTAGTSGINAAPTDIVFKNTSGSLLPDYVTITASTSVMED